MDHEISLIDLDPIDHQSNDERAPTVFPEDFVVPTQISSEFQDRLCEAGDPDDGLLRDWASDLMELVGRNAQEYPECHLHIVEELRRVKPWKARSWSTWSGKKKLEKLILELDESVLAADWLVWTIPAPSAIAIFAAMTMKGVGLQVSDTMVLSIYKHKLFCHLRQTIDKFLPNLKHPFPLGLKPKAPLCKATFCTSREESVKHETPPVDANHSSTTVNPEDPALRTKTVTSAQFQKTNRHWLGTLGVGHFYIPPEIWTFVDKYLTPQTAQLLTAKQRQQLAANFEDKGDNERLAWCQQPLIDKVEITDLRSRTPAYSYPLPEPYPTPRSSSWYIPMLPEEFFRSSINST